MAARKKGKAGGYEIIIQSQLFEWVNYVPQITERTLNKVFPRLYADLRSDMLPGDPSPIVMRFYDAEGHLAFSGEQFSFLTYFASHGMKEKEICKIFAFTDSERRHLFTRYPQLQEAIERMNGVTELNARYQLMQLVNEGHYKAIETWLKMTGSLEGENNIIGDRTVTLTSQPVRSNVAVDEHE